MVQCKNYASLQCHSRPVIFLPKLYWIKPTRKETRSKTFCKFGARILVMYSCCRTSSESSSRRKVVLGKYVPKKNNSLSLSSKNDMWEPGLNTFKDFDLNHWASDQGILLSSGNLSRRSCLPTVIASNKSIRR